MYGDWWLYSIVFYCILILAGCILLFVGCIFRISQSLLPLLVASDFLRSYALFGEIIQIIQVLWVLHVG